MMALEGTINTPAGKISKKTAAMVGAGGVLIVGVVWYRNKSAAATANTSADTSTTDTTGYNDTGYLDTTPTDTSGFTYGPGGYDPYGGYSGYYGGGQYPPGGPGTFTSNSQWSQYVENYMVNTLGSSATTVGNALGKYITGQAVDDSMISIINQAIAFAGYPPVSGPGGNPPGFNHTPGPPGGGTTAHNPVAGLHIINIGYTSLTVGWNPDTNAKSYLVTATPTGNVGDKKTQPRPAQARHMTVDGTYARIGNLTRKVHYDIKVRAQPGGTGGSDAHTSATTK